MTAETRHFVVDFLLYGETVQLSKNGFAVLCSTRLCEISVVLLFGFQFKCQQYWPDEQAFLTSGDINVLLDSITHFADFCIRYLIFERVTNVFLTLWDISVLLNVTKHFTDLI